MNRQLREIMERIDRVERESFKSLCTTAVAQGTGWYEEGGVAIAWSARDNDPGFSCIFDIGAASDPDEMLIGLEERLREVGALAVGIDTHPDLPLEISEQWYVNRGYQPAYEECVWYLELESFEPASAPASVEVRRISQADAQDFGTVLNRGFGLEKDAARGPVFASTIGLANWRHYLVVIDDELAAAAAMFICDGVADCFVASTIATFRRRGAQTALIQARLADAIGIGCDLATAQSVVTNASPRNFARKGFQPVYRRWIFGKQLQTG